MDQLNRIKEALEKENVSQAKLARALDMSPNTISRYCRNEVQPTLNALSKIAKYLKIDIRELIAQEG